MKSDPLADLRPRNDSSPELQAALARTVAAIERCGADLQEATQRRGEMMLGLAPSTGLVGANSRVETLKKLGVALLEMHTALTRRLAAARPPPNPEEHARQVAIVAEFVSFWAQNGSVVQQGLQLFGQASVALAHLCAAAQAAPSPPPSASIVPLRPGA